MIRIKITAGFLFILIQSIFSQSSFYPSFIVKNSNDTIYGTGNISKNQEYCLFKKFDATEFIKYYPNEINAFRVIGGKFYVSKEIKESDGKSNWYFLEFLVDGKIDLFTISNSQRYFLKKENEDFLELYDNIKSIKEIDGKSYAIQNKNYLGYLRFYMSETPQLYPEIDKMNRLEQRKLVKLSVDYHNAICNEYGCVNYTKDLPKVTYKFELFTGVTHHNKYYTPQIGVLVHVWSPLTNEKLFIKTGIIYSDSPYFRKESDEINDYTYTIKIPISFQYVFGKKKFKPTFAFGWPTGIILISSIQAGFVYSISKKYEISLNGSLDGVVAALISEHHRIYNNQFGHSINCGIIYNFKK